MPKLIAATLLATLAFFACSGPAGSGSPNDVVVYVAHDRVFSEPILRTFEEQSGIRVLAKYDTEATKTTQLVASILNQGASGEVDVFWNNEFANTLTIQRAGLTDTYVPLSAKDIPTTYQDGEGHWVGFGCRARVILYNTELVKPEDAPTSIHDLCHPRFKDKVGIAHPLFGTTKTHLAALFATLGPQATKEWFEKLLANGCKVEAGNAVVRNKVAEGTLAVCLTDTDDANGALLRGAPVKMIYPDQADLGTLVIPNTVCLIKGSKRREAAGKLIEYLTSAEVEARLAKGKAAQMPVRSSVKPHSERFELSRVVAMNVPYGKIADQMEAVTAYIKERLDKR